MIHSMVSSSQVLSQSATGLVFFFFFVPLGFTLESPISTDFFFFLILRRDYTFANVDNLEHCTKYLNQTMVTFGFPASLDLFSNDPVGFFFLLLLILVVIMTLFGCFN